MNRKAAITVSAVMVIIAAASMVALFHHDGGDSGTEEMYRGFDGYYEYTTSGSTSETYASTLDRVVSDSDVLFLQSALEGYPLKTIGAGSLSGCSSGILVVPATVKTAEDGAFEGYGGTVVFLGDVPEGVHADGNRFLTLDVNGGTVETAEDSGDGWSVTYLLIGGCAAVMEAEGTGSLDVPEAVCSADGTMNTVTMVGCDSFRGSSFVSVTLPATLERICTRAFYGCDSLEDVRFPESLVSVEDEAFRHCTGLRSVDLGGVRFIGFEAFRDCRSITDILIPDSVTYMGAGVFYICSSAERVMMGAGVTAIPDRAFGYCSSLGEVIIEGCVSSVGSYAFAMCGLLVSISLPDAMEVGSNAFTECRMLSEVTLGAVETMGSNAFGNCRSLTAIVLPETLAFMGESVFLDCRSLEDIWFNGPMPVMADDSLSGTDATIHVSERYIGSWDGFDGTVVPFSEDQIS